MTKSLSTGLDTVSPVLEALLTRRSVVADRLGSPGPDRGELDKILQAGARVPDHKVMVPWRFILFEGEARKSFGEVLAAAFEKQNSNCTPEKVALEARRFLRAPVVIAVISKVQMGVVPDWEQILSAGAVCQNLLHAANALGFASQWVTEWYAYDAHVAAALGLSENERVAGFVYIGTPQITPKERRRPDMESIVSRWQPADQQQ